MNKPIKLEDLMITETRATFNGGECQTIAVTLPRYVQDGENDYLEPVEVPDSIIEQIIVNYKLGPHHGCHQGHFDSLGNYHRDMPEITKTRNFIIIESGITHYC